MKRLTKSQENTIQAKINFDRFTGHNPLPIDTALLEVSLSEIHALRKLVHFLEKHNTKLQNQIEEIKDNPDDYIGNEWPLWNNETFLAALDKISSPTKLSNQEDPASPEELHPLTGPLRGKPARPAEEAKTEMGLTKHEMAQEYFKTNMYMPAKEHEILSCYEAGFDSGIESAARIFEGSNQSFSTEDDTVDLTYRVMSILSQHIRALKEVK